MCVSRGVVSHLSLSSLLFYSFSLTIVMGPLVVVLPASIACLAVGK